MLCLCFTLFLTPGETNSVSMEENKKLLSASPDESLQALAEVPSAFNSLKMLSGAKYGILMGLLFTTFEVMFEAYIAAQYV